MKKLILASAISAAFAGGFAQAEEAAKSDHVISYNVGVTSDYVFRGISQSRNRPAFSGGVDYSHAPTGLYAGTWVSTISWIDDSYAAGNITDSTSRPRTPYEQDFYAGIKVGESEGLNFDVGAIYYYYPRNKLDTSLGTAGLKANTAEVYSKIAYGPVYFKVNYATGDAFFVSNKRGSYYLDLGADISVMEGLILNMHAGRFAFKDAPGWSYSDWKVGLTKDFGNGLSGALAATGTNAQNVGFWNFNSTGYLGDTKGIVSLTKTF